MNFNNYFKPKNLKVVNKLLMNFPKVPTATCDAVWAFQTAASALYTSSKMVAAISTEDLTPASESIGSAFDAPPDRRYLISEAMIDIVYCSCLL